MVCRAHRRSLILIVLFAVTVGGLVGTRSAGSTAIQVKRWDSYILNADFTVTCRFSHTNADDMIRFPRQPGWSHNHTYVGNRSASTRSTLGSLRVAATTCDRQGDTAAYWMPTLYANRVPVLPDVGLGYYRRATRAHVVPFPQGLRIIAGDMMAMRPQSRRIVAWNCLDYAAATTTPYPPVGCGSKSRLVIRINFPNCWNGKTLNTPDHMSHLAYSERGLCPATHPVAVPALSLDYRFPRIPRGARVALASGGLHSSHADFVNSWDPAALRELVELCLNEERACGSLPPRE